ncbi:plasmid partitioning protein RepB [Rhizobium sp. 2YAF20]|uniref:plasmid partitioning protein RepB n=1 Tax=Rhizobium sp. 2YAF20 TaxID=3233027 RepID=UPI003F99A2EE
MSKAPRKSIVASFGLLSAELESTQVPDVQSLATVPSPGPGNRVGAGVIGAAHRAIDDIRAERDQLKAFLAAGVGAVQELDTSFIDPSPYPDRLPEDDASEFEAFKHSIETEGQKVPVQVRKHPSEPGRYQIVYGHRRWLAAKALGRPVRAIEVSISDLDLVVAQGIENANRQDLTWIERALFASRMDDAGIRPRDIYAALSIEDAELARMRSVYRSVPTDVIEAIGRAPKIGRPRWLDLAKMITHEPNALEVIRLVLSKKGDLPGTSNQRFQLALSTITPRTPSRREPTSISNAQGRKLGAIVASAKEVRISAEGALGVEFIKYVEKQLPTLAEQFTRQLDNEKP